MKHFTLLAIVGAFTTCAAIAQTDQQMEPINQEMNPIDQDMDTIDQDMNTTEQQMDAEAKKHVVAKTEFDMMDTNKDGSVSKQEASDMGIHETFSDMDENGDELISRVEYTQYRESDKGY